MGILGMKRFIREHDLSVHLSIQMERGLYIPVAVDTWNVLMPVMRKLDPNNAMDTIERTLRGMMQIFALLNKKSCFPVFVFDGGRKRAFKSAFRHDYRVCSAKARAADGGASRDCHRTGCCAGGEDDEEETFHDANTCADSHQSHQQYPHRRGPRGYYARSGTDCRNGCGGVRPAASPHYKLCWDLITAAGFPTVYVNGMEADYGCANLFHTKTVMYVWSNDSDLVFMGCDVITDLTPAFPVAVFSSHVLNYLKMTHQEFANTFVDCHTNLHSPETIYSFAAKLLEHQSAAAVSDSASSEESSDQQSTDDDEYEEETRKWNRCSRQGKQLGCRGDNDFDDANISNASRGCVSVLCGFPADKPQRLNDCDLACCRERGLPLERDEEPRSRLKKNKEFLDYMNSFIGPKIINDRHTLIKRVPINQSPFSPCEIHRILREYSPTMAGKWCNEILAKCKLKQLPPLREVACGQTTPINIM